MLYSITVAKTLICTIMLLMITLTVVQCKAFVKSHTLQTDNSRNRNTDNKNRQLIAFTGTGRETTTPDFIRLVVMRFIYGMASTMGVEDRLEGIFNGAFVPPNADIDIFGFADDVPDTSVFGEAAFGGIFDDDVF